jgi:isopentenyldiphosphate isomerase
MTINLIEEIQKHTGEYRLCVDPKLVISNWVAWVDDNNHFILWASRKLTHQFQLAHRSVQVMIFTEDRKLVLQKRNQLKATYAGYWDMSASGHVEAMDYTQNHADLDLENVYEAVAYKEVFEEIGIQTKLSKIAHFSPINQIHYEHFDFFTGVHSGPFIPQPSEVEEIRCFHKEEMIEILNTRQDFKSEMQENQMKFTPSSLFLTQWMIDHHLW